MDYLDIQVITDTSDIISRGVIPEESRTTADHLSGIACLPKAIGDASSLINRYDLKDRRVLLALSFMDK